MRNISKRAFSTPLTRVRMHVRVGEQVMWNYMLTLSTFILTFFLKECYDYWGTAMDLSRRIQGICPPSCVRVFVGRDRRRIGSKT